MTSAEHLEELRLEAAYQRQRLALYRAKVHGPRATTVSHLRQRERECAYAEGRLRRAEQKLGG
jgi:hypothetical protein